MSRSYSVEALVINRRNVGEADKIITFLSKFKGKFDASAKGVRKVASRRGPNLDLLNHVKASFASGKTLDVITEVRTVEAFKKVKNNLEKVGYGFHITELVKEFLEEGQGGKEVFDLMLNTLNALDSLDGTEKTGKTMRSFEIKFLSIVGYKPQLKQCFVCGNKVSEHENFISPEVGGVVDKKCSLNIISKKPISTNAIKILHFLQNEPLKKISKLKINSDLNLELENQMRFYIEYLLDKELKSIRFINQVRQS